MSYAVDRTRTLSVIAESAYGQDPDADGSSYAQVEMMSAPFPDDQQAMEESRYAVGRNARTRMIRTTDQGEIEVGWGPTGLAASAGDGASVPAVDVVDVLITNALGSPILTFDGKGVNSGSGVGNAILDAAVTGLAADVLIPLWVAASSRVRWRPILSAAGAPTYTVSPNWESAPLTADILYGARLWGQTKNLQSQGASIACAASIDGTFTTLLGGRHTKLELGADAGGLVKASSSIRFDSFTAPDTAKTQIPAVSDFNAPPTLKRSPLYWGGTDAVVRNVKLGFGLKTAVQPSTTGDNARQGDNVLEIDPVITFDVDYLPATWRADKRAGTERALLLQLGGGGSTSMVNSWAFYAPVCEIVSAKESNKNGYAVTTVTVNVTDVGSNTRYRWLLARC